MVTFVCLFISYLIFLSIVIANLHDFLSAFRVRFLSRGAVRGVDVAVLTNDSNISSSPSVNVSSDNFSVGVRCTSGRRRRSPVYGDEVSTLSTDGLCDPNNCLNSIHRKKLDYFSLREKTLRASEHMYSVFCSV